MRRKSDTDRQTDRRKQLKHYNCVVTNILGDNNANNYVNRLICDGII